MGRPKQLLPVNGRPLLQIVIDAALASCVQEIVLVLGHRAHEIGAALHLPEPPTVRVVTNSQHGSGMSTSLQVGLHSTDPRSQAAAILLGDQPGVTPAWIDYVARAFFASDLPIARPVYRTSKGDRVPGHPVFLARTIWPQLQTASGDSGARDVIVAHPEWTLQVPVDGDPPTDVDLWEDYEKAVRLLNEKP